MTNPAKNDDPVKILRQIASISHTAGKFGYSETEAVARIRLLSFPWLDRKPTSRPAGRPRKEPPRRATEDLQVAINELIDAARAVGASPSRRAYVEDEEVATRNLLIALRSAIINQWLG